MRRCFFSSRKTATPQVGSANTIKTHRCVGSPRHRSSRINLNVKPMKGDDKGAWRLRVGNYRVIYDLYDGELVVWVIELGYRRDI
ncbi:MAG: hypothetical protein DLM55_11650 [Acidimicrobiales bacterium]|nr:MAG: hypothetical protein DLM55_11650 [Acidimicrobiales bacterium]